VLLDLGAASVMEFEDNFRAGCKIVIVIEPKYLVSQLKALIQHFKGFANGFRRFILD